MLPERSSYLKPAGLFVLAALSACTSTPPYERPAMAIPAAFREAPLYASWQAANTAAAEVPDDWWKLFGDPALDALQAQVALGNQSLQSSVAQYRAAQATLASSRGALWPSFGLGLDASRSGSNRNGTGTTTGSTGAGVNNSFSLTGTASWEVDLWGRLSGQVDTAQAQLQASRDDLAAAELSVRATLTQTYFSLRAAEAQSALLQDTLAAYQRSLDLTQNRYQGGVASAADVAQAQNQLKSTQAQRIEAESSRAQLEHALAVLLGRPPGGFSLPRTATLPAAPDAPLQLPAQLLERRPDIAAAERRVAAANAQIGVARTAFFPALTLSASTGYRGSVLADLVRAPNLVWSLGPALALTAFDGGQRQAAVDSARAAFDQATAGYRQAVLTALQEVEDNLVIAASLQDEAGVLSEALVAARRALEVTDNQYRAGTVSYLNVVSAQTAVLSAERSLLDVRNRRLAAIGQLLKNIAGRWDQAPVALRP
ncbi:RND transporter [Rhodoferax koreense]|uniref:RND transporter n=1 Tax=Rhodoferax koreensis TaxID=1842727 RepID=A0A1P8JSY2_9BURK|nr:efflux transporter outer membrane subunit [Rhodoferax koreense]APW36874.1 RND transporter [Rhodoferax koreense]